MRMTKKESLKNIINLSDCTGIDCSCCGLHISYAKGCSVYNDYNGIESNRHVQILNASLYLKKSKREMAIKKFIELYGEGELMEGLL